MKLDNMVDNLLSPLIDLFSYFDREVQATNKSKKKQRILMQMFLIECKYNLDVVDIVNFKDGIFDITNCSEIIKLFSCEALERIVVYESVSSSFISEKLGSLFLDFKRDNDELDFFLKDGDKILNLYKRIRLLKSISEISHSNSLVVDIKFKIRLKNLKVILLEILKNYGNI